MVVSIWADGTQHNTFWHSCPDGSFEPWPWSCGVIQLAPLSERVWIQTCWFTRVCLRSIQKREEGVKRRVAVTISDIPEVYTSKIPPSYEVTENTHIYTHRATQIMGAWGQMFSVTSADRPKTFLTVLSLWVLFLLFLFEAQHLSPVQAGLRLPSVGVIATRTKPGFSAFLKHVFFKN